MRILVAVSRFFAAVAFVPVAIGAMALPVVAVVMAVLTFAGRTTWAATGLTAGAAVLCGVLAWALFKAMTPRARESVDNVFEVFHVLEALSAMTQLVVLVGRFFVLVGRGVAAVFD